MLEVCDLSPYLVLCATETMNGQCKFRVLEVTSAFDCCQLCIPARSVRMNVSLIHVVQFNS